MGTVLWAEEVDLESFAKDRPHVCTEKIEYEQIPQKQMYRFVKRSIDVVCSLLALIVLLIPMCLIAVVITIDSPGGPIFSQVRLGKDQQPFRIYKFRTMYTDAEKNGPRWASRNDMRTTRVGRALRNSRLDELPQLINILIGQMSFVGPRPERPEFYDVFDTYIDGFRQRMFVKPGLTGLAQVNGGYDLLPEEKIIYDIDYIKNCSISMDIHCLLKTVNVVFGKKGAR